jgi:SpoVK/Ycf46/Vps4 family AAA+-type ATPase
MRLDSVEDGWPDIEIDQEIKAAIMQMVDQPANSGRAAYGILKKGRIGGALLYGPPGTGKTHLARILARECQTTTISASAADIVDMYVGETEKAIKGLFNLGRMIAPCIIFIDDADSLFHARGPGDRSWERSRTNQLLTEMDGLIKANTPPFILLATNFPRQLDHAVLRRAPCRLHIGLPSVDARKQIFRICLRDERTDADVDFDGLADATKGYSGSDIQTLCVQAALICEADHNLQLPTDESRILKDVHFEKALKRSAPNVSKAALAHIREFAKEFDPNAWSKMNEIKEPSSRIHRHE